MAGYICQKGPTRHAYAWQIGPFRQDALDMPFTEKIHIDVRSTSNAVVYWMELDSYIDFAISHIANKMKFDIVMECCMHGYLVWTTAQSKLVDWFIKYICFLTRCGLMTPDGDIGLGQICAKKWLGAWWHEAINQSNIFFPLVRCCAIYLRTIS